MAEKNNVVFIGNKPPMNYVLAVISILATGKEVVLKARGRAISTAVDVAEITRRRFITGLTVGSISIGTEEMPARDKQDRTRMVSTIEVVLKKD